MMRGIAILVFVFALLLAFVVWFTDQALPNAVIALVALGLLLSQIAHIRGE